MRRGREQSWEHPNYLVLSLHTAGSVILQRQDTRSLFQVTHALFCCRNSLVNFLEPNSTPELASQHPTSGQWRGRLWCTTCPCTRHHQLHSHPTWEEHAVVQLWRPVNHSCEWMCFSGLFLLGQRKVSHRAGQDVCAAHARALALSCSQTTVCRLLVSEVHG